MLLLVCVGREMEAREVVNSSQADAGDDILIADYISTIIIVMQTF